MLYLLYYSQLVSILLNSSCHFCCCIVLMSSSWRGHCRRRTHNWMTSFSLGDILGVRATDVLVVLQKIAYVLSKCTNTQVYHECSMVSSVVRPPHLVTLRHLVAELHVGDGKETCLRHNDIKTKTGHKFQHSLFLFVAESLTVKFASGIIRCKYRTSQNRISA